MEASCVENFYKSLQETNASYDLYHFDVKVINDNGKITSIPEKYPQDLDNFSYYKGKLKGKYASLVVENIFSREVYRKYNGFKKFDLAWGSVSTATIMVMVGLSKASSYVVVTSGLPALLLDTFSSLTESRVLILLLLNLLFLIIGMLMEANAAIIMMTPILMPLLTLYGINPLMFGIVMSFNLCIGLVTPPVGLCLLLSNQIGETSLTKSLKALMPMLLISICVLLLITYVDPLTTWLPSLLKK